MTPRCCPPTCKAALQLPDYAAAQYEKAVGELPVLEGEGAFERRMRELSYLHLTRFVRMLLDRKDRTSMAVGLEVRVPFCDHRLVECVFNAPWALKSFDGREKSLLRHATADTLPRSVVERVKSPYPSTQDPDYAAELQSQAREVLATGNPALALLDEREVRRTVDLDPARVDAQHRNLLERALNMSTWFDLYKPAIRL